MKKSLIIVLMSIILLSIVSAAGEKIEVSTIKDSYQPGEEITLKVSLLDSQNNPLSDSVSLTLENADKTHSVNMQVNSNKITSINLGDKATAGYWSAFASYNTVESKVIFTIESSELAQFNIEGDTLTITNVGNSYYSRDVQILIGDTIGVKKTGLEPGEKISFRLIAPDGSYNIKVTDGVTTISKNDVALTGNAIGVLDENMQSGSSITGGARVDGTGTSSAVIFSKNNTFAYIFVLVIVGAGILLAIERRYNKMSKSYS